MKFNVSQKEFERLISQPGQQIHFAVFMTKYGFYLPSDNKNSPTVFKDPDKFFTYSSKHSLTDNQLFLILAANSTHNNPQEFLEYEKTDKGRQKLINYFNQMKVKAGYTTDEYLDPVIKYLKALK